MVIWWMQKAFELQELNRATEAVKDWETYEQRQISCATIYTREDLGLCVSLLDSVNLQLHWINIVAKSIGYALYIIVFILAYIAYRIH